MRKPNLLNASTADVRYWAYAIAAAFCLSFSYDLSRIPVQVTDSLGDIQEARSAPSAAMTFVNELDRQKLFRPLKAAQIRIVSDLSRGHLSIGYRATHVILFALTIVMFVRVLQVRTAADVAAAAFALTVLLGSHTFASLLREAFPINHFLEMVLFALIALRLAQGRPGWVADAAAAVTFAAGALVVESGLLIWVVIVAARLSGMRGISRRGVTIVSVLLCTYAYLRFAVFSTGMPMIDERSSGFFLGVLEPDDIQQRFGDNPLPFYAYNVMASALSVLFTEPRAGLLVAVSGYLDGNLQPWVVVAVVSSVATTVLIAIGAIATWRDREIRDDASRLYFIAAAVIAANAVLSYGYLKDDILSIAGVFYALAAYVAVRRFIRAGAAMQLVTATVVCALMLAASTGWAMRTAGLHYNLRYMAFKTRNEWARAPERWMQTPQARAVTERLRKDALERTGVAPRFYPPWETRWFEE